MWVLPANRYCSLDAKINPDISTLSMPQWCSWVMISQLLIVYVFSATAKFYSGWIDGSFPKLLFFSNPFPALQPMFDHEGFPIFIAYSGILFDLLVIPLLLYRKTRTAAVLAALFFHIFNAVFLQIGIFPFFALTFVVFFYPPTFIQKLFLRKKPAFESAPISLATKHILIWFFIPYFVIQLALPIRHWFIPHAVLWTEEGHRLSWRMMLRSRQGDTQFRIIDKNTRKIISYNYQQRLTRKQQNFVASYPDGIWQMAQVIKKEFNAKNQEIELYVNAYVSINGGSYLMFIDPTVDFTQAKYNYFGHDEWIVVPEEYR